MTTGFFAPKVPPSTLAVTQMAVSTALLLVVTPLVAHITLALGWQAWAAILWTALSGTIYAFFIQSWAQRYTTSTHAAVLLCFESVFAAVSGVIFGLDTVTWRMVTGASLIFTGVLLIELLPGGGGENQAPAEALVPIASGDRARPAGPGPDEG
jgi:drug/metabolite transporter (DMT)-like permease